MNQYAGLSRFAFNWGLARRKEAYEQDGTTLNAIALHKELIALKKEDFAWMYNYSKSTPQEALRDLDKAFQNFFRRVKQGAEDVGYPKFKSKHTSKKKFKLEGAVKVENGRVRLPRIGWLRLKERGYLPMRAYKFCPQQFPNALAAGSFPCKSEWILMLNSRQVNLPVWTWGSRRWRL